MKLLLVEDEAQKLAELRQLFEGLTTAKVTCARSVRSAIDFVREGGAVDLIILDMSLPTFDIDEAESGGTPRPFGGIDVMRSLVRYRMFIPTVVFTGYQSFEDDSGTVSLESLTAKMREEFGEMLIDVVQYTPFSSDWGKTLKEIYEFKENGV